MPMFLEEGVTDTETVPLKAPAQFLKLLKQDAGWEFYTGDNLFTTEASSELLYKFYDLDL